MRRLLVAVLLASIGGIVAGNGLRPAPSAAATARPSSRATARTAAGRGLVYAGLALDRTGARCPGAFVLAAAGPRTRCTHGPDPAPLGIDVRRRRAPATAASGRAPALSFSAAAASVPCYGDGADGNRVQALYVHAADVADRYSQVVGSIRQWAAQVDSVFDGSAAETGGVRHVRFVTDASCSVVVQDVRVSSTGDDSMDATVRELQAQGFTRSDRKYLVWVDANVYCGIAQIYGDDTAVATNLSNGVASVAGAIARVDNGCWGLGSEGQSIEAHELMHTLGGVQKSAPHATTYSHCWDESDRMCYADGSGATLTQACPASHENLFDCNHDDYFSTAAPTNSYLATHWNTADSSFLAATVPNTGPPPVPPPSDPPPPDTTKPTPDGTSNPAVVRSGTWFVRKSLSTGRADVTFAFGNAGDFPLLCDWDGDGAKTPGVFRNGWFFLTNNMGPGAAAAASFPFGDQGDFPVCGDWNGDGIDSIGVVRGGVWYLRNSNSNGPAQAAFGYGNAGDRPVVGHWDGKTAAGIGVVRDGVWYLRNTADGGAAAAVFAFGDGTDGPVSGDWDGDGVDNPGVFRAGTWYLRSTNTAGPADTRFAFGDGTDAPLTWR